MTADVPPARTNPDDSDAGDAGDAPRPPSEFPGLAEVLDRARGIPWESVDLETPAASVESIGAQVEHAEAILKCECGQTFRMFLDGETYPQRCPKCKQTFRHAVTIQGEQHYPSAMALSMRSILEAQAAKK